MPQKLLARRSTPQARRPTAASCGQRSTGCSVGHPGRARSSNIPKVRSLPATTELGYPTSSAPPIIVCGFPPPSSSIRARVQAFLLYISQWRGTPGHPQGRSRRSLDRCDTIGRPAAGWCSPPRSSRLPCCRQARCTPRSVAT